MDIKCTKCGSEDVMFSKKRNLYICEDCGHTFALDTKTGKKIFFSYGHDANTCLVSRIKRDIEAAGYTVWIDKSEIKAGDEWRTKITTGLLDSQGVIAFLSKHSVRDPGVCLDEIRIALTEKHGNIKTILLESEKEVSPPTSLSDVQWLDMSDWTSMKFESSEWEQWYSAKFKQLLEAIDSDEFQSFQGEIEDVDNYLLPVLSDVKELMLLSKEYIGREWLASLLENWRINNTESKAFILFGESGSGKSCFMANQIHYNSNVICGVFCEWNRSGNNPANTVTKLIAHKLAAKLPDYRKLLLKKLKQHSDKLDSMSCQELFDFLVVQPLSNLIDGGRDRRLLLIDGLDEAEHNGCNELANVLADSINKLPPWLAIVITSRPESDIVPLFKKFNPFSIDAKSTDNINDVRKYLIGSLEKLSLNITQKQHDRVIKNLDDKCRGNFLYASLFLDAVKQGDLDILDYDAYPSSIDSFYEQTFRRKFGNDNAKFIAIQEVLELIIAENRLPASIICKALNISLIELKRRLSALGSMVSEEQTFLDGISQSIITYSFAHKSFIEWLTDYEKNYNFFIDKTIGATKLLNYYKKTLIKDLIPLEKIKSVYDYENYFIQTHIINTYIYLEQWKELEQFLLEQDTPLFPYWCCVNLFPDSWEKSKLVDRLWCDINLEDFLETQQRRSERRFIEAVVGWMIERFGIDKLKTKIFNIYIDMIHVSGNYRKAVSAYTDFLNKLSHDAIINNKEYLMIAIRKIHNSMFFVPVETLIKEAMTLVDCISGTPFKKEYNELLFLLGGNLAVLNGDMVLADEWVTKSFNFAIENNFKDYEARAARKLIDIYCSKKEYTQALEFSKRYISPDAKIESRYEIYLLGAIGEVYRHLGNFDQALSCYQRMYGITLEKGIMGWVAHAFLGQAAVYLEMGLLDNAQEMLNKAKETYDSISQIWGQINAGIVSQLLDAASGKIRGYSDGLISLSETVQYRYCTEFLRNIDKLSITDLHLYFL